MHSLCIINTSIKSSSCDSKVADGKVNAYAAEQAFFQYNKTSVL